MTHYRVRQSLQFALHAACAVAAILSLAFTHQSQASEPAAKLQIGIDGERLLIQFEAPQSLLERDNATAGSTHASLRSFAQNFVVNDDARCQPLSADSERVPGDADRPTRYLAKYSARCETTAGLGSLAVLLFSHFPRLLEIDATIYRESGTRRQLISPSHAVVVLRN